MLTITKIIIIFSLLFLNSNGARNNVCKNLLSYIDIERNKNCYHNPDLGASPKKIIKGHGYPFESHVVTTEDGYILHLYRIPHNRVDQTSIGQPVFIQHGSSSVSTYFLTLGNNSLPFLLSNAGYDVWLANARGTEYSLGHLRLNATEKPYWNFSFHEMAIYDVPASINIIEKENKSGKKIIYIGHSMGTSIGFIYSILKKEHANRHIEGLICLCPVAYLGHIKGLSAVLAPFAKVFHEAAPVALSIIPTTFSTKTLFHYAQDVSTRGKFRFYDYGKKKNLQIYQSAQPPNYDISQIDLPTYLFYGKNDFLATETDVRNLYENLTVQNKLITPVPMDNSSKAKYNHVDFLFGKNVHKYLYQPLIEIMKENFK